MHPKLRHLLATAGLLGVITMIGSQGFADVGAAFAAAGWGLLWVSLAHLLPLALNTQGWRILLADGERPGLSTMLRLRWIGESVNTLLPVAQIGGELARGRALAGCGLPGPRAGASVMVDFTVGLMAQLGFTLLGIVLLLAATGMVDTASNLLLGLAVAALLMGAFFLVQRWGLFGAVANRLQRQAEGPGLYAEARTLDAELRRLYARHGLLLHCAGYRLAGWLAGTIETWLALWFLGHPVGLAEALILESLGYAARSLAFAIPGALGVQEGAVLLFGSLLGLDPATALALALMRRVRELAFGLPGLWCAVRGELSRVSLLRG